LPVLAGWLGIWLAVWLVTICLVTLCGWLADYCVAGWLTDFVAACYLGVIKLTSIAVG